MENKHTAGQWLMNTTKKFMADPYLSKGLAITSDKGVIIAFVDHTLDDKNADEYVANAKVIAAAPLLLEALKKCQYQLSTWIESDSWTMEDEAADLEAQEAINKATE